MRPPGGSATLGSIERSDPTAVSDPFGEKKFLNRNAFQLL